jgi:hypothetical protein
MSLFLFAKLILPYRRLLCKANDQSGMVETEGPHKSSCKFNVPIGCSFTVARENIISRVTRTRTTFIVEDTITS